MGEKRGKSQERMQTQAKPCNRNFERNISKTINNLDEKEESSAKKRAR